LKFASASSNRRALTATSRCTSKSRSSPEAVNNWAPIPLRCYLGSLLQIPQRMRQSVLANVLKVMTGILPVDCAVWLREARECSLL
jgi:hypothetical protein